MLAHPGRDATTTSQGVKKREISFRAFADGLSVRPPKNPDV
jgi:hypothetical protein